MVFLICFFAVILAGFLYSAVTSKLGVFAIYFFAAILTGFLYSVVTSMLIVFGIERTGGDPGTPAIMFIVLMLICGILSIITALLMSGVKWKFQKEFPAKFSAIIFLVMYLPVHIIEYYFPEGQLDFLVKTSVGMLFLSYIPLFHMAAQTFINVYEYFNTRYIKPRSGLA